MSDRMKLPTMKVTLLFALILLPAIVHAHPGYDRFVNEKSIGSHDAVLDVTNIDKEEIAMQVNEDLLGTVKQRQKRLSDQRRAELETLMALSKMTGKLVTVSRGGRQLDTAKIGRRRRSVFELNLKNLRKLFRLSGSLGQGGKAAYRIIS